MINKVDDSKYQIIVDGYMKICREYEVRIPNTPDDMGGLMNSQKTKDIEFVFYGNSLKYITTPDGCISFGTSFSKGNSLQDVFNSVLEFFGLLLVGKSTSKTEDTWFYYKATKNI